MSCYCSSRIVSPSIKSQTQVVTDETTTLQCGYGDLVEAPFDENQPRDENFLIEVERCKKCNRDPCECITFRKRAKNVLKKTFETFKLEMAGQGDPNSVVSTTASAMKSMSEALRAWWKAMYDVLASFFVNVKDAVIRFAGIVKAAVQAVINSVAKFSKPMRVKFANFVNKCMGSESQVVAEEDVFIEVPFEVLSTELEFTDTDDEIITLHAGETDESVKTMPERFVAWCAMIAEWGMSMFDSAADAIQSFDASAIMARYVKFASFLSAVERYNPVTFVKRIIDYVYSKITGAPFFYETQVRHKFDSNYETIVLEVKGLEGLKNPPVSRLAIIAEANVKLSESYVELIPFIKNDLNNYKERYNTAQKLCQNYRGVIHSSQRRIKPVSILFRGHSGMGKTQTESALVTEVPRLIQKEMTQFDDLDKRIMLDHMSCPSFKSQSAMSAPPTQWEGYTYPMFYTIQELCSATDGAINAAWTTLFFEMIDDQPLPLHMAFEGKGSSYFDSPFVIATTNKQEGLQPVFEDSDALNRRLDLDFQVTSVYSRGKDKEDGKPNFRKRK